MRHFFTFVVSTTMATLSLAGCGSDDNPPAPTQCMGNNAEFTPAEFSAETAAGKACSSASDVSTVCANNMPLVGGQCGKSCLGMSNEEECVPACIQDALASGSQPLSEDCLGCYTADIACAKAHCLIICGVMPTSAECLTCRTDNGCVETFYACSGLPEPIGP